MNFFNITALKLERHLAYCDLNIGCDTLLSHFRDKCQFQSDCRVSISSILQLPVNSQITNIQFSWFKSVPNDFSLVVTKTIIMVITL